MSKTVKNNNKNEVEKGKKLHYPDYTLSGIASKPKFFKGNKEVNPPKNYKPKCKLWPW
jgi:hypothetical protein